MSLAKDWLIQRIFGPVMRPIARLIVGMIAIPLLRAVRARVQPTKEWDEEFEKDLDQWFRASVVLLLATKNVELAIAAWMDIKFQVDIDHWWVAAGRLLLAIGVVESMPDQQLFSIIHPGPPKLKWIKGCGLRANVRAQAWPFFRGLLCQHLNRSSPVLAIMAAIFDGTVGWVCYTLAIIQYLIIGLVTSRDKALDVLSQFDREMERRRKEIVDEFDVSPSLTTPMGFGNTSADASQRSDAGAVSTAGAVPTAGETGALPQHSGDVGFESLPGTR